MNQKKCAFLPIIFSLGCFLVYADEPKDKYLLVEGGTLPGQSKYAGQAVDWFYISPTEVTWSEWKIVQRYALGKGYDLNNVGSPGPQEGNYLEQPVRMVSWFDAVKWCNAKSEKEGLKPVYKINSDVFKNGENIPEVDYQADGYRLPTPAEWEWAARGGNKSKGFKFSGGDNPEEVAWYRGNSATKKTPNLPLNTKMLKYFSNTKKVKTKKPNELGIYDMSGNVYEWCFIPEGGAVQGGCWACAEEYILLDREYRHYLPQVKNLEPFPGDFGFRPVRNKKAD
jgi:formylglycine-generating enzyme required for sulfatase activity